MYVTNPRRRRKKRRSSGRRRRNPIMNLRKRRSSRRRSNPRRRARRSGGGGGGLGLRGLLSRDNLTTAAGIGLGAAASNYVLGKWGNKLPGYVGSDGKINQWLGYAYLAGLGAVAAFVAKRAGMGALSRGLLMSGPAVIGIKLAKDAVSQITTPTVGTSAYLNSPNVRGLSRLPGPQNHSAVSMFSALPGQRVNAFPASRFAIR